MKCPSWNPMKKDRRESDRVITYGVVIFDDGYVMDDGFGEGKARG